MELSIRPLSPELADDYFDFFEHRAFTDGSPYRCYCQIYQMTKAAYQTAYEGANASDIGKVSRAIAARQIASGALRGYLAYVEGVAIGWCNANERSNYPDDAPYGERFHAPAKKQEIAVTCFEIAPGFRGQGVATALLQRVIDDARENGHSAVVGFPVIRDKRFEWDNMGPVRLFEKLGFTRTETCDGYLVMCKFL